ncbi:ORF6N domain-containing protein [Escherichia coli]|uniref:ORF6N domain-containing protein n=1 Tax=Escherichia coli TaxID=562 RepID=UPI000250EF21|nr:ORF6N domain-containing protein [Escherichia coli]EEW3506218.1 ORF6N domain-containing protein [Escherichia coli O157:NM]EEX7007543.1 ORF6N domain-containing protein [Escherichia coli O157]EHV02637.1 anti-termination protein [Escherichia coli DEC4B]EEC7443723.1 ORF6N domain-containing protein [Escherichia coli]EEC7760337.1 ORF6N domain-containing protein [Escherichia coli]
MTTKISVETLSPITHNQIPVITTELLAQLYGTEPVRIRQNHHENKVRFVEGKHFFKVVGNDLKELRVALNYSQNLRVTLSNSQNLQPSLRGLQISPKARSLILWTERGAARHAKMLETDRAWEVFEKLEDCYFSQKIPEQLQLPESTLSINYPLSWFSEHHPYSMMSYVDRKTLNLDVSVLFDMPSPTMRILNELHSKGYNVDAAVAEFNAFKHLTEEMRRTLQDISRLSDRNSRKGFSLSL